MKKIRMGVIGTGSWATQHHIPSLIKCDRAELVAISDVDKYKLKAVSSYYGIEHTYENYKDMLDLVDGVVIAVPHVHHYEIARNALNAEVSVLIEKPMTLESKHAWDLVKIAEERNLHLMVGTSFQFTRHARRIREVVRSGHIGEIRAFLQAPGYEDIFGSENCWGRSGADSIITCNGYGVLDH